MVDPVASDTKPENAKGGGDRVVIKKYANRRLYNTASSSYVTLEHLSDMVKKHVDFVVYDAKTNDDITRSVLTQIIFEEENRGTQNLLPIQFLRQLIRFYGDSMQALLPSYLELSLDSFTQQQERMRSQLTETLGGNQGLKYFDDQVRQNMQLFDRAMKMFSPFTFPRPEDAPKPAAGAAAPTAPASAAAKSEDAESLSDLKKRLEEMQQQIEKLASKG
ncbi:MAG TPA: polyhydroxyalkanoate synthesis repressor PhaR [Caulobacteraceae bacterium]|nr:polyhydroxyalkanoate synthesis repressor PhaR [Caulobacteraceae bacterium]